MFNVTKLLNQENITLILAVVGTLKDIRFIMNRYAHLKDNSFTDT